MSATELVLVAHGTRSRAGVETVAALAEAAAERVGSVRTAFVDVLGPSPTEVLCDVRGPAVLVPAFLASGYHVHTDVPRAVADSGHPRVVVTRALGPHPALARVLEQRLRESGWRPDDAVVLAAAGSSDPRGRHDVRRAARCCRRGCAVTSRSATSPPARQRWPRPSPTSGGGGTARVRRVVPAGARPVHTRLGQAGADGVAGPLGAHDAIADLVAERFFWRVRERRGSAAEPQLPLGVRQCADDARADRSAPVEHRRATDGDAVDAEVIVCLDADLRSLRQPGQREGQVCVDEPMPAVPSWS